MNRILLKMYIDNVNIMLHYRCTWDFEKDQLLQPKSDTMIWIDIISDIIPGKKNIYLQVEPEAIYNAEAFLLSHYNRYDHILTYNKNILEKCPNTVKYVYGITWIDSEDYNTIDTQNKRYQISMIVGGKAMVDGHHFRQKIFFAQEHLTDFPIVYFRSCKGRILPDLGGNRLLGPEVKDKIETFKEFQFAIIIENNRQDNYFSEKLIDCLITRTIPIYYGASNIGEYFSIEGWIILDNDTVDGLKTKLSDLTPDFYSKYTEQIDKNYNEALKYVSFYDTINQALRSIDY